MSTKHQCERCESFTSCTAFRYLNRKNGTSKSHAFLPCPDFRMIAFEVSCHLSNITFDCEWQSEVFSYFTRSCSKVVLNSFEVKFDPWSIRIWSGSSNRQKKLIKASDVDAVSTLHIGLASAYLVARSIMVSKKPFFLCVVGNGQRLFKWCNDDGKVQSSNKWAITSQWILLANLLH